MKKSGHTIRHPELSSHPLILWEPTQGKASRGRRRLNYVDMLRKDTGLLEKQEIRTSMPDRGVWWELSNTDVRVEDQQDHPQSKYRCIIDNFLYIGDLF